MALYAVDDDDLIDASCAQQGKTYWCLDCFGPVKRRKGKSGFFHFYHVKSSPQCRLYSKTEDHLLAQLQLQRLFGKETLQIERPFPPIDRVADLCWESEKIIFEIQCSLFSEKEAQMRMRDYESIGYQVVWLLDDKRYNKRVARPAEEFLRRHSAYYLSLQRGLFSKYYDQFEIFYAGQRVKKSKQMPIDLQKMHRMPKTPFPEELFPKQITQHSSKVYFFGDRLHFALQNHPLAMGHWRTLEIHFAKAPKKPTQWWRRHIAVPYMALLHTLIRKVH